MNNASDFAIAEIPFAPLSFDALTDPSVVNNNPLLLAAKQQLLVIEAERNVSKAEALPDFKVGYFIQSIAGPQEVSGQTKTYSSIPQFQGVHVGVNVPIFGRSVYKAKNDAMTLQLAAQQKQTAYLQTQLNGQLKQYVQQYDFDKNNVSYYEKKALPNAQLMLKNATKSYQSGDIGYIEYAQTLQMNLETKKAYLEAINGLNKTVLALQFVVNQ